MSASPSRPSDTSRLQGVSVYVGRTHIGRVVERGHDGIRGSISGMKPSFSTKSTAPNLPSGPCVDPGRGRHDPRPPGRDQRRHSAACRAVRAPLARILRNDRDAGMWRFIINGAPPPISSDETGHLLPPPSRAGAQ
jgi:hypothetical protein